MIERLLQWLATKLRDRLNDYLDPGWRERRAVYDKNKATVEAKEKIDDANVAAGQEKIASDASAIAEAHEQQVKLENDADTIEQQRKDLRDEAATTAPARPADDDILSAPLPGGPDAD